MADFPHWVRRLLTHGESIQDSPPILQTSEHTAVVEALHEAFVDHALEVAGQPIPFDPATALKAIEFLSRCCWSLLSGESLKSSLRGEPTSPSMHLSGDVVLRYLAGVYRRARAGGPSGELAVQIEGVLRRWPLSGVLADLDGRPDTSLDFCGHPGLQLLYAERLVRTGRAGWLPGEGQAREWVDRVFSERGRPIPVLVSEDPSD